MLYAVITGDIVDSSQLNKEERKTLLDGLKQAFQDIEKIFSQSVLATQFEIYRGDSFQGVLKDPVFALKVNFFIRARLKRMTINSYKKALDARMAVGIGDIEYFSKKGTEGDGTAYRLSGPVLDDMKGDTRLAVKTPNDKINKDFAVACALTDYVISKWTVAKAEVMEEALQGKKQQAIAENFKITQGAVNQRLKNAGWHGLEMFLNRYEEILTIPQLAGRFEENNINK